MDVIDEAIGETTVLPANIRQGGQIGGKLSS